MNIVYPHKIKNRQKIARTVISFLSQVYQGFQEEQFSTPTILAKITETRTSAYLLFVEISNTLNLQECWNLKSPKGAFKNSCFRA